MKSILAGLICMFLGACASYKPAGRAVTTREAAIDIGPELNAEPGYPFPAHPAYQFR